MFTALAALSFLTANVYASASSNPVVGTREPSPTYDVKPFTIDLGEKFENMIERVKSSRLPDKPEYPGSENLGIRLDHLVDLKTEWTGSYNWTKEQDTLNSYKQYTVNIEGIELHFIHEKSAANDAIPIILQHGWPGTVLEFIPVITSLTQQAKLASGKNVSFNVVVPSLPGFLFSSTPPANWTADDTARIFNTLMIDVLGYPQYAVHGTDWGSATAFSMYDQFNSTVRAAHFTMVPFFGPTPEEAAAANITLSEVGKVTTQRFVDFVAYHSSYFGEQTNEPNTIGYALYDNPVGQLSWIGNSFATDNVPPGPPSLLDNTAVLTAVSLSFLTDSFVSSVYMYAQNPNTFTATYRRARTDAPMLFSNFQYNYGYWPLEYAQRLGNVVYITDHDLGGHFAGLDNPPALIEDLRQIGDHWVA